jgi:4'-phosphopantetheinyl transferase
MAERCAAPEELRRFLSLDTDPERNQFFIRLWTLKESYLKAIGVGLRVPLGGFSVLPVLTEGATVSPGLPGWHFREYDLGDSYALAVCGQEAEFDPRPVWVEPGELIP